MEEISFHLCRTFKDPKKPSFHSFVQSLLAYNDCHGILIYWRDSMIDFHRLIRSTLNISKQPEQRERHPGDGEDLRQKSWSKRRGQIAGFRWIFTITDAITFPEWPLLVVFTVLFFSFEYFFPQLLPVLLSGARICGILYTAAVTENLLVATR